MYTTIAYNPPAITKKLSTHPLTQLSCNLLTPDIPHSYSIHPSRNPAQWLGIDSGILGVCEPMFSMTIQRY